MIPRDARPRLASKARLRKDRQTGDTLLLYPEAGLKLNGTGAAILRRCTGQQTIAAIVEELAGAYTSAEREVIEREVTVLVSKLVERGLLVVDP
jgi:pyrroloquinoline quinone biosynthesis protein D